MARPEGSVRVVVSDAGPLIHLDELGCLDLLADFSEVLVPDAVWREVEKHRPHALEVGGAGLRRVAPPRGILAPRLRSLVETMSLHRGEQEALAVAAEHEAVLLLTDDAAARLAAGTMKLEVHGTIGILIRSIRRGLRTKGSVLELLSAIPGKSTLHLKPALLEEILQQVARDAP